jgi:hypothetical protein
VPLTEGDDLDPHPHPHPRRYRNFLYGCASALDEMDKKKGGLSGLRG